MVYNMYMVSGHNMIIFGQKENLTFSDPEPSFDLIFSIPPLFKIENTVANYIVQQFFSVQGIG